MIAKLKQGSGLLLEELQAQIEENFAGFLKIIPYRWHPLPPFPPNQTWFQQYSLWKKDLKWVASGINKIIESRGSRKASSFLKWLPYIVDC